MPWFTDAGLLYYRSDLLEKSRLLRTPKTWTELKEMANKIKQDEGIQNGFVFQGDQYEGGVCNGLEYIWTHGGDVLDPSDPNKVVIDSPEAAAGLATEASMISDGVTPQSVSTYTETETDPAFLNGEAVFARNWPYMYALAGTEDYPKVKPEQIGIAPLPLAEGQTQLASALGGWNMLISADLGKAGGGVGVRQVHDQRGEPEIPDSGCHAPADPDLPLLEDPEIKEKVPVVAPGRGGAQRTPVRARSRRTTRICPWRWPSSSTPPSRAKSPRRRPSRRSSRACREIIEAGA